MQLGDVRDPGVEVPQRGLGREGRGDPVRAGAQGDPAQLVPARETLRDFGNMSSATVMFVLQKILRAATPGAQEAVCSMAFGPGLTVETALLTVIGAAGSSEAASSAAGASAAVGSGAGRGAGAEQP